jgi:hypothetical protein
MTKKINLEKLFDKHFINDCDEVNDARVEIILFAKEFGKQLLELAAENASVDYDEIEQCEYSWVALHDYPEVNRQSIIDTIKQIE